MHAAVRPQSSGAGRAQCSGHDNRPHVCSLWSSVLRLKASVEEGFVACCLLLSSKEPTETQGGGDSREAVCLQAWGQLHRILAGKVLLYGVGEGKGVGR